MLPTLMVIGLMWVIVGVMWAFDSPGTMKAVTLAWKLSIILPIPLFVLLTAMHAALGSEEEKAWTEAKTEAYKATARRWRQM